MKYIELETAIEILRKSHKSHAENYRDEVLLARDIRLLKEMPAADVSPVKRGSWIVTDADDGMCEDYAGFIEFKCSECGCNFGFENGQYDWYYGDPITWKACPMCGAKMDGERREG